MSVFNICMNVGSFNINIKINKKIKNNNIASTFEHEKRIKEAIEKRRDLSTSFYNNISF